MQLNSNFEVLRLRLETDTYKENVKENYMVETNEASLRGYLKSGSILWDGHEPTERRVAN